MAHHEMFLDREVKINVEDISDYCKQFADFMQAQIHRKYDLISSKKRSREPERKRKLLPKIFPHC